MTRTPARAGVLAGLLVALGHLSGCSTANPENSLHLVRAQNALLMNQASWARHFLEKQKDLQPDDPDLLKELGSAYMQGGEGSLTRASACFSAYLEQRPNDQEILAKQASIHLSLGDLSSALNTANRLEPGYSRDLLHAQILAFREPAQALVHGTKALRARPEDLAASLLVAKLLIREGQHTKAKPIIERAIGATPLHKELYYLKARIHQALAEPAATKAALFTFDILEQVHGIGKRERLKPSQALKLLTGEEHTLPNEHPHVQWLRCRFLLQAGRLEDADQLLDSLASSPGLTSAQLLRLARLFERVGRHQVSTNLYEHLLTIETIAATQHEAKLGLARITAAVRGDRAALHYLAQAFDQDAPFAQVHFVKGTLYLKEGDSEQAMSHLQRGLQLAPWQTRYRILLADQYLAEGRQKEFAQLIADYSEFENRDPRWEAYTERMSE